jgi:hypothetical protein
MLGALAEAKERKMNLTLAADRVLRRLDAATALATTQPLQEVDTSTIRADAAELDDLVGSLKDAAREAGRLQDELGLK